MSLIHAIIFGIVQGITEFLPISSTAHIVIAEHLFQLHFPGLSFEIMLHLASLLAVMFYFRKDLVNIIKGFFAYFRNRTDENRIHFFFSLYILAATAITGVLGTMLEDILGERLKTPAMIAGSLAITGVFLILIEHVFQTGTRKEQDMRPSDALIVGIAQSLAVIPGISRSGSTLIAALWIGLNRETAVRYSFLLSIPVIMGSSLLTLDDIQGGMFAAIGWGPLLAAFMTSFVCSIIGIVWLIDFLNRSRLIYFAIYCFVAALFVILFLDPAAVSGG